MSPPLVSIIIVNYKTYQFLHDCLVSIKQSSYSRLETIVFDNSSDSQKIYPLQKKFPRTRFITNKKNLGFSLANNQAVEKTRGRYLFFLNPDTKIAKNTISLLVKKIQSDPHIGICGPTMLSYNGKTTHHCGIGIDFLGFPLNSKKIFYVEGSALMIGNKLFQKLKGFDPTYFMFHEDVDLCWRCWLHGFTVTVEPSAKIFHQIGAVAGGTTPGKKQPYLTSLLRRYYSERNNLRTLLKNYQTLSLVFVIPLYLIHHLFEFIFFILTLQPQIIYFYIKGYLWNLINLPSTLRLRHHIQNHRQISDRPIFAKMNFTSGKLINLLKVGIPKIK